MSFRIGYEESKDLSQISYLKVEDGQFENNTKRRSKKYKRAGSVKEEYIELPLKINIDEDKLSTQHLLKIEGVEVFFPLSPYPVQIKYMEAAMKAINSQSNALLQSPTGTGKVLSLLCSIMGWLNEERVRKNTTSREEVTRVIYTARNYTRLKQVIKELKSTCYMPSVSFLGDRDHLCIKPEFQTLKKNALDAACHQARHHTSAEHRCAYYDKLEKNATKLHQKYKDRILDIEELHQIAKRNTFCPYYYQQQTKHDVDLILMSYTDLFDKSSRLNMEKIIKNAIIVFDEGHNILSALEDGISFDLSSRNLLDSETDVKKLQDKSKLFPDECKLDAKDLNYLSGVIRNLSKNFGKWRLKFMEELKADGRIYEPTGEIKDKGKSWPGKEIFKIFKDLAKDRSSNVDELCEGAEINPFADGLHAGNMAQFRDILAVACDDLSDSNTNKNGLDHLLTIIDIMLPLILAADAGEKSRIVSLISGKTEEWETQMVNCYDMYVRIDPEGSKDLIVSFWCHDPAIGFRYLQNLGPRSILITSSTLMPLKAFEKDLKSRFPIQLTNNHLIDIKTQSLTVILKRGINNVPLKFSSDKKESDVSIKEFGNCLINFSRIIPNGILVLFGSNELMSRCMEIWSSSLIKETPVLERLELVKKIFKEDNSNPLTKSVLDDYTKAAKGKGAIFFSSFQGKAFEEYDFVDEMSRGVIVIGVPFQLVSNRKTELKKIFLESNKLARTTIKDYYLQQTVRTVNQSFGKAIRNPFDYGIVILCDERYDMNSLKNELPEWTKQSWISLDNFGIGLQKITNFFKDKASRGSVTKSIVHRSRDSSPVRQSREATPLKDEKWTLGLFKRSAQKDNEGLMPEMKENHSETSEEIFFDSPVKERSDRNESNTSLNVSRDVNSSSIRRTKEDSSRIVEENGMEALFDSFYEDKTTRNEKGNSLFNMINKKKESLGRREPLEPKKSKQTKPPADPQNVKRTFLKNFELDYNPQPPVVVEKSSPLKPEKADDELIMEEKKVGEEEAIPPQLRAPRRFILNRRLIGSDKPEKQPEIQEPVRELNLQEPVRELILQEPETEIPKESHNESREKKRTPKKQPVEKSVPLEKEEDEDYNAADDYSDEDYEEYKPTKKRSKSKKGTNKSGQETGRKTRNSSQSSQRNSSTRGQSQKVQASQNTSIPTCMICYATSEDGRVMCSSKCGHIACQKCWEKWFESKLECPMCKKKVRSKTLIKINPATHMG